jgi:Rieske Fe-S protein
MGVTNDDTGTTSRRAMLAGAGAAGVVVTLAACGSSSGGSTAGSTPGGGGAGGAIKAADVPVGGGKIFKDQDLVVTQPAAGQFKAFTATCTHAGCPVSSVSDGTINCNCHGSRYSVEDGSVKNGPATKGLTPKTVTVSGDSLTVS